MIDLEAQVTKGQASLGQLIRQFLAVNDFKHVQFMSMAHAVSGERWLHSSQISTLKRGATKNLTGFPLYSVALVNKKIWEINRGLAGIPSGTRKEDWENKLPMTGPDGDPLDVGDLWRIYFGEMQAPFFSGVDATPGIDEESARKSCNQMHSLFRKLSNQKKLDSLALVTEALKSYPSADAEKIKQAKGVLLGVTELTPDELMESADEYAEMLSKMTGEKIEVYDILYHEIGSKVELD
jgi:hypothetical protein